MVLIAMTDNTSKNIWDKFTKTSKIGPSMESLNTIIFQFSAKILFWIASQEFLIIGGVSEVFSKYTKFPAAIASGRGEKAFFAYHMITWLMSHVTPWVRHPHPKSQMFRTQ